MGLDSKHEKGERKIADDFIVLINEQAEDSKETSDMLHLVSINESALQLSPYNFDIQMH